MFDIPDNLSSFTRDLKTRRTALGLTQQDVADMAGVQRQTIGRLERGDPTVSLGTAMLIADALGLSLGSVRESS